MTTNPPTLDQLKRGLEIAQQIAALEAQMAAIFTGKAVPPPAVAAAAPKAAVASKGKRKFSAKALANIRAAQKRRWAKVNAKTAPAEPAKSKRKFSAKALANIRAAQKKRWANKTVKKAPSKPSSSKPAAKVVAPKAPVKKKRKLAPEVRAKLAAAMKARWDAAKKAGTPPPTAKK
jgi:hypothetical protein